MKDCIFFLNRRYRSRSPKRRRDREHEYRPAFPIRGTSEERRECIRRWNEQRDRKLGIGKKANGRSHGNRNRNNSRCDGSFNDGLHSLNGPPKPPQGYGLPPMPTRY